MMAQLAGVTQFVKAADPAVASGEGAAVAEDFASVLDREAGVPIAVSKGIGAVGDRSGRDAEVLARRAEMLFERKPSPGGMYAEATAAMGALSKLAGPGGVRPAGMRSPVAALTPATTQTPVATLAADALPVDEAEVAVPLAAVVSVGVSEATVAGSAGASAGVLQAETRSPLPVQGSDPMAKSVLRAAAPVVDQPQAMVVKRGALKGVQPANPQILDTQPGSNSQEPIAGPAAAVPALPVDTVTAHAGLIAAGSFVPSAGVMPGAVTMPVSGSASGGVMGRARAARPAETGLDGDDRRVAEGSGTAEPAVHGPMSGDEEDAGGKSFAVAVAFAGPAGLHPTAGPGAGTAMETSLLSGAVPAAGAAVQVAVPHAGPAATMTPHAVLADASQGTQTAGVSMPHTMLQTTATSLEVGVSSGTHGWLKIRAELTAGGGVQASLTGASAAAASGLRNELPALATYLQSERVPVSSLVVAAVEALPPASAPHHDDAAGQMAFAASADGAAAGGRGEADAERRGPALSTADETLPAGSEAGAMRYAGGMGLARPGVGGVSDALSVEYGSGGSWLNVRV